MDLFSGKCCRHCEQCVIGWSKGAVRNDDGACSSVGNGGIPSEHNTHHTVLLGPQERAVDLAFHDRTIRRAPLVLRVIHPVWPADHYDDHREVMLPRQ